MTNDPRNIDIHIFKQFEFGPYDKLQIAFGDYRGKRGIDIRKMRRPATSAPYVPQKQGLFILPKTIPGLLDALTDAEDYLIEKGLLLDRKD